MHFSLGHIALNFVYVINSNLLIQYAYSVCEAYMLCEQHIVISRNNLSSKSLSIPALLALRRSLT